MFKGIENSECTRAKHIVFQEPVSTTLKPTSLVEHEIYFKAEGDSTLRRIQPENFDEVVLFAMLSGNQIASSGHKEQVTSETTPKQPKLIHEEKPSVNTSSTAIPEQPKPAQTKEDTSSKLPIETTRLKRMWAKMTHVFRSKHQPARYLL